MGHQATPVTDFKKDSSTRSAALFLSRFGIAVLAALMILAAWAGQTVVVILLGLALSAAGLSKLWSYLSLKGVHGECSLTGSRVFPGEYLELKLRVVNRKLLPLPSVQLTHEIPSQFMPDFPLTPGLRPGFGVLSHSTSLLWYSSMSWKHRLCCTKRGYYSLGPLSVTSGDIFGFYPRTAIEASRENIIVYPRIYPLRRLAIPSLYPLGEAKSERRPFEDPSRMIGVRDYNPADGLRRIHWKASARHQSLQVKVFEPTTALRVALFIAIDSFQYPGLRREDEFELGISTAASLASYLIEMKSQLGIWANSKLADSGLPARIPPGSGVNQLAQILESLAKVTSVPSDSFVEFFQRERSSLPLGTSLIFIASQLSEELRGLLSDLCVNGYGPSLFQIGEAEAGGIPLDIARYLIRRPDDLAEGHPGKTYD